MSRSQLQKRKNGTIAFTVGSNMCIGHNVDWSNSPDTSGKEIFELWIIISYVFMPVCLLSICLWCDIALWCYACGKCVHVFIVFPYFNWVYLYIDVAEYKIMRRYKSEKFCLPIHDNQWNLRNNSYKSAIHVQAI